MQKRQKELLEEWKNSCNLTLKWIADTSARVQAQATTAEDLDHARAQRQEIEVGKSVLNLNKIRVHLRKAVLIYQLTTNLTKVSNKR